MRVLHPNWSICASQFESDVFIGRNGNRVNAKSIMGVMMLAASKGVELELEVDGNDEQELSTGSG